MPDLPISGLTEDTTPATTDTIALRRASANFRATMAQLLGAFFGANQIIKADSANTPVALTVAEQTLVGRITSGAITALSVTQVRTLLATLLHSGVANELAALTEKTTLHADDLLLIEDSEAAGAKKKVKKSNVSSAGTTVFADNAFRVQDNGDATKQIALEASAIATGTTRTITVQDENADLQYLRQSTTSQRGTVELATQAELDTGTDTARVPSVAIARKLTANNIWIGNGSNIATEVGEGGAAITMGSPWCYVTTTDPDETDTGIEESWRWINTSNGKIWVCLASGVWRCLNVVVETVSGTGDVTVDNTWDGSIKRFTGATADININVPNNLNNGLTFEVVSDASNLLLTFTMSSGNARIPADFTASTVQRYSSAVVTVLDSNECLIRGHLVPA